MHIVRLKAIIKCYQIDGNRPTPIPLPKANDCVLSEHYAQWEDLKTSRKKI